jgi:hypothetical protein
VGFSGCELNGLNDKGCQVASVLQRMMLVNLMSVWSISLPFWICGRYGTFFPFWYVSPRKIWQPRSTMLALLHYVCETGKSG